MHRLATIRRVERDGGTTRKRRTTGLERLTAVDRLDSALSEGRLSAPEHGARVHQARLARAPGELAALLRDLPEHAGDSAWDDQLRVRALDLHRAAMCLGEALATGALSAEEYRRRLTRITGALTYATLKNQLDGVPAPTGQKRAQFLVTTADRGHVAARIDRARADRRIGEDDHRGLHRGLRAARRYRDLDRVADALTQVAGRSQVTVEPDPPDPPALLDDVPVAVEEPPPVPEPVPRRELTGYERSMLPRLVRKPVRRRIYVVLAAIVAVTVATMGVAAWCSDAPGPEGGPDEVELAWEAPFDRPADARAVGTWLAGPTVIRARTDRLTAYDVATGKVAWSSQVPSGAAICAMSRETWGGIGIVVHGPPDSTEKRCTTVTALDLETGRQLWERTRRNPDPFDLVLDDEVGLAASTAVVADAEGFVGLGARDGTEKWRRSVPAGCEAFGVAAAADDAVLLSACGRYSDDPTVELTKVGAADGAVRFSTPLNRIRGTDGRGVDVRTSTTVLSISPLVVRTAADDSRADAIVSFDDDGRRHTTIPLAQAEFDLRADPGSGGFSARRPPVVAVIGGLVVATALRLGAAGDGGATLIAYSLADGTEVWHTELSDLDAWTMDGTRIVALIGLREFQVLAAATGRPTGVVRIAWNSPGYLRPPIDLRLVGDRYVISVGDGTADTRPVSVLSP